LPAMDTGKLLCLNMIVKNEMANLKRCLEALAPHIACWVIGDTGSTDGTPDFIMAFFAARDLPGELQSFPFENFEQARNAALDHAYASPLAYDYLLFADADMELVVEDPGFRAGLAAPGYRLMQRSGLTYWNTRLVRRDVRARYRGVTHEYIDVPGGVEALTGAWYKDHATGANRSDKAARDIRLLSKALKDEPDNRRYWFYLAQSYKDAGRTAEAEKAYARRAAMGGWNEEAWYARLQRARCLCRLGDEGGFLREALAAFEERPTRAEPLYDLARFYRERGMHQVSALFSEAGLAVPWPEGDALFVEDAVYEWGLAEEYSIAAFYRPDKAHRERGFAACNRLALNRQVPAAQRDLARANLSFYLEPAGAILPSFAARPVAFAAPCGYHLSNPSVARRGDEIVMVQRTVNYIVAENGDYRPPDGAPVHTRNFLLRLTGDLEIRFSAEILPPQDMPEPAYWKVLGFEDMRLFVWRDALWCTATLRELTPEGWCDQVLARIEAGAAGGCRLADWRVLRPPGPRRDEKNWMPLVEPTQIEAGSERLQFVYLCDPTRIVDDEARTIAETMPAVAAVHFRGGSQAIAVDECLGRQSGGGFLALIHEVLVRDGRRHYSHRFVWLDREKSLRGVSRPFYFSQNGIEFAAGLAWHPDGKRLLISYGVGDGEAWIATVEASDVLELLA
jgi:glycosyltransferase involved in cell wall biosynthesis